MKLGRTHIIMTNITKYTIYNCLHFTNPSHIAHIRCTLSKLYSLTHLKKWTVLHTIIHKKTITTIQKQKKGMRKINKKNISRSHLIHRTLMIQSSISMFFRNSQIPSLTILNDQFNLLNLMTY